MFDDIIIKKRKDSVMPDQHIICCVTCKKVIGYSSCLDFSKCMSEGKIKTYKDWPRYNKHCLYSLWERDENIWYAPAGFNRGVIK